MNLWDKLQGACVLEEFKRVEVQATSLAAYPPRDTFSKIFADAATTVQDPGLAAPSHEKEAAASLKVLLQQIDGVRDESFVGKTPATAQALRAERHLLQDLFEKNCWHRVDDAFNSGLLPEGQLLHRTPSNTYWFVVKSYPAAALLWPAKNVEVGLWERDLTVHKLTWVVCYDISEYKEIPTAFVSPLSLFVQDHTGM